MLFTIVIPVYDVEPYLRDCLNSVLAQTCGDWDAICVDDGSTDGSSGILDEYAAKDSRFKVIHQLNAGVGPARNRGLDLATGEWVVFLDGDDVYSPWALETLCKSIIDNPEADIHAFKLMRFNDKEHVEWGAPEQIQATTYDITVSVPDNVPTAFFGSKAYSRHLLEGVRFPNLIVGEDLVFIYKTMELASCQINLNAKLYGYRQRGSSVMHKRPSEEIVESQIAYSSEVMAIINHSSKKYSCVIFRQYANAEVELVANSLLQVNGMVFNRLKDKWLMEIKVLKGHNVLSPFQRIRAAILIVINIRAVIWLLGALPYRLKVGGLHR